MPSGPIPKHTITEDRSPNLRSRNTHDQGGSAGSGGDMGGSPGGAPKVAGKPRSYSPPSGVFDRGGKPKPL
jgi:hypothetical protein